MAERFLGISVGISMRIPKCMSTQHPDNVVQPFFAHGPTLGGEDEIEEAYYAFSHLGCDEQMWDAEGKEVDGFVVKKLLSKYPSYFSRHVLGDELFLTLRVPNPAVERTEAKILLETLESIPRSFDATRPFLDKEIAPIFEVILPMTSSERELERVHRYYCDQVVGKQDARLGEGDVTVAEWVGEFRPESINVIPLYEDLEHMLAADRITERFLANKQVEHQRVFLARSDPAMNYGFAAAVLLNKVALARLERLAERSGVRIYPIVGVGSAPFRGNLVPSTVARVASEYPSVHTFTVQSAFKYDYEPDEVRDAITYLRDRDVGRAQQVDEDACVDLIRRTSATYERHVVALAPMVQRVARHVPARRKRKLHVGLFGYARAMGSVRLPRAISFTAAMYSVGLPPEILGLEALDDGDRRFLRDVYTHVSDDLGDAVRYLNPDTGLVPPEVLRAVADLGLDSVEPDEEHRAITSEVARRLASGDDGDIGELVVRAARLRRFLG